jgi:hypothetical protein
MSLYVRQWYAAAGKYLSSSGVVKATINKAQISAEGW